MIKAIIMSQESFDDAIRYLDKALNALNEVSPSNFSVGEAERNIQLAKDILTYDEI